MTLRTATVLTAREWESALVARARETAEIRLVLRALRPGEIVRCAAGIDVVVAGAEVPWVTPARIGVWRRRGLRVIGVYPAGDRPARDRLDLGRADATVPDDLPTPALLRAVCLQGAAGRSPAAARPAPVVVIAGPRGAPGRTEVALALAWARARVESTLLLDLDRDAPGIAVRLGLPPRPDVIDAADAVLASGALPAAAVQHCGGLSLVVGSHRTERGFPGPSVEADLTGAAAAVSGAVVIDAGPRRGDDDLFSSADRVVLVATATPAGLIRAARLAADWEGPRPDLVLNRVRCRDASDVVRAARAATGLEPAALIPERAAVSTAIRDGRPPDRSLLRALQPLPVP